MIHPWHVILLNDEMSSRQTMERHVGTLNAYYQVKEASLKSLCTI